MLWQHPVAPIIQQENLKQDQENHRQMRGYQTGIGGVALTLREHEHEQKQLPYRADLNDAEQAGREDEPLKHNEDRTDNSSTDSTNMKEPFIEQ